METSSLGTTLTYRGSDQGGGVGGVNYTEYANGSDLNYKIYNLRGDVIKTIGANQATKSFSHYYAFGNHDDVYGSIPNDDFRANTKVEDDDNLLNEGKRFRHLELGIFLTPDPLEYVDGFNQYIYVNQNPWGRWDPTGLDEVSNAPGSFNARFCNFSPEVYFATYHKNTHQDIVKSFVVSKIYACIININEKNGLTFYTDSCTVANKNFNHDTAKQRIMNVDHVNPLLNKSKQNIIDADNGGQTIIAIFMTSYRISGNLEENTYFQENTYSSFVDTYKNGGTEDNRIEQNSILEHAKDNSYSFIGNDLSSFISESNVVSKNHIFLGAVLSHLSPNDEEKGDPNYRSYRGIAGRIKRFSFGVTGGLVPSDENRHSESVDYEDSKFNE